MKFYINKLLAVIDGGIIMSDIRNQHFIEITELGQPLEHLQGSEIQFLKALNWEPLMNIMSDLSHSAFIIWIYLNKWRGKGVYEFSPANIEDNFGISDVTIRKYKKELIDKGYLKPISTNRFIFIPYPENVQYRAAYEREQNHLKRIAREKKKKDKKIKSEENF